MKRILLFIDSLGSGGAQRQMVGLAKLLKDKGYSVKLIYYHPIIFYKPYLDEYSIDNECVKGAANKWKRLYKIYNYLKRYKPDVVISYLDTPNMVACVLRLVLKYKLITSERNTTQNLNIRERLKFFLMHKSDVIVSNSYSQKTYIDKHFPDLSSKVKIITNFVDTEFFRSFPRAKEKSKKNLVDIVCIGRITVQKNILSFLDALQQLNNKGYQFRVNWFGYKEDKVYYAQCMKKLKMMGLEGIVSFKEPIRNIVQEYQKADVFCLPSVYEGFPNALCEAMSCGLPVLCSNVCDNPMIIRDNDNGLLFNPYDVNDIVAKFEAFFYLSSKEKELMRVKSESYAMHFFSKKAFLEKYEILM